jgi:hypothetical protein
MLPGWGANPGICENPRLKAAMFSMLGRLGMLGMPVMFGRFMSTSMEGVRGNECWERPGAPRRQ